MIRELQFLPYAEAGIMPGTAVAFHVGALGLLPTLSFAERQPRPSEVAKAQLDREKGKEVAAARRERDNERRAQEANRPPEQKP